MPRLRAVSLSSLAISLLLSGAALANTPLKPEEMIKFRKAGYSFISWNMGRIKANLEGTFNADEVAKAANAIAGIANSGMGALFAPGTDKDHGDQKTRLKSEFFAEPQKVREIATAFNTEANALAKVAASGDKTAIAVQFKRLGDSCKTCHDAYRAK